MKKLVFDIGASAIKYACMDDHGTIYERGKTTTPQDSLDHLLTTLENIYKPFEAEIDGIAISLPGTIDTATGQIYAPGGLLYNENVNLVEQIHRFTSVPVVLENDGKSAALAEVWQGNLKECKDGIVLVIGSGIGGGIIKDGKLWKGEHLFAGEFSYILYGDTMTLMDVWAMQGSTTALLMDVGKRKGVDFTTLNGVEVFDMIASGDEDAIAALDTMVTQLAKGIFNLQCILDPQKILIGGGISQQPILLEHIQKALDALYEKIPFVIPHAQVETCCFYNDSNLIGALYQFLSVKHEAYV